ncbi:MAG: hypothetical protein F2814_06025 [Actinobacteria bacterium]|nr:hypothetical protein [Actinomycetota bacterium]
MSLNGENSQIPHWRKQHVGEHRAPVAFVVFIVIFLQYILPSQLSLPYQKVICLIEAVLLSSLFLLGPTRFSSHHLRSRVIGMLLTSIMTLSNTGSAVKLIDRLVNGGLTNASQLLWSGGSIWLTNIVIFSLWYWDLDRGGPGARAQGLKEVPDFLFPQMSDEKYAAPGWHPTFFDYVYVSITNASAFSPTDAMPLTKWAKALMLTQSLTSLLIVGLVIARAVNILQ